MKTTIRGVEFEGKKQELRELLKEFPFLRNIHFVRLFLPNTKNNTLSAFAKGKRNSIPELEDVLVKCKSYIAALTGCNENI